MSRTIIGLDLDQDNSQISFYNERNTEPETVSMAGNQECYLIPTPDGLFSLIENSVELGRTALANFLKTCIGYIRPAVTPGEAVIMITMRKMGQPWADALRDACQILGIPVESVFLQTHRESFCWYTLNQKRDLWAGHVALFEYEDSRISSCVLDIDYSTKPALVSARPEKVLELGTRGGKSAEQWNEKRDRMFLDMIQDIFQQENFSAIYLIGDSFDKTWAVESLQFLCRKRHVFQGRNLYTKGACYAAMRRMGVGKRLSDFLYSSEDLVTVNLSMRMEIRGKISHYMLINAGVNWFEAEHVCEFLVEGLKEVVLYGKPMRGEDIRSYSIPLKGLPDRPGRTTRLQMRLQYISAGRCKVTIRDLGFGEFYPPSGLTWESVLEV